MTPPTISPPALAAALPAGQLVVVVAAILVAAVVGFVVGWFLGKRDPSRQVLERAERAKDVLDDVVARMESARADCDRLAAGGELAGRSVGSPRPGDAGRLEASHATLGGAVAGVVAGLRSAADAAVTAWAGWSRGGTDPATGLPDADAVDANIARLAATGDGGVLLISVDGWDRLRSVRGGDVSDTLKADLFRVAVRAGRDDDFVGVVGEDAAALLFRTAADASDPYGPAAAVRDAVKRQRFFAGDGGPEVIVTASFGVTPLWPGDTPASALARCREAADRSRRGGRNRLHGHDGLRVVGPLA